MSGGYSTADVARGYAWLGHTGRGYTEVTLVSRGSGGHRRARVDYVTSCAGLLQAIADHEGALVLVGLNPRPRILAHEDGRLRAATNPDVTMVQNVLWDLDTHTTDTARLDAFVTCLGPYWRELGIAPPVIASSGRGRHLLFAIPPLDVSEHPGIAGQLRTFHEDFRARYGSALGAIAARADSVFDLRRSVKAYGTRKAGGPLSVFPAVERKEDPILRDYLLSLSVRAPAAVPALDAITPGTALPTWFPTLVEHDDAVRALWHGKKERGDTSSSGIDYSLARALVMRGYCDPADLGTIVSLRPGSSVKRKGRSYLEHTVANALRG